MPNFIKETAKRHNVLLQDIASRMGISVIGLSKHVNGNPSVAVLERIAEAIGDGCTPAELVTPPEAWASQSAPVLRCPHCGKPLNVEVK